MTQKDHLTNTSNQLHSIFRLDEELSERETIIKERNAKILDAFHFQNQSPDIKRSHLFNGRYENIYIDRKNIPEIDYILDKAIELIGKMTGEENIKAGFWFNHMAPDSKTLPHRHDDDDEIMSGVYYISVPEHSGNLIIHSDEGNVEITPEEGLFVFFKPDIVHEVSSNNSQEDRLSIGMNFGIEPESH